jgi:hypothetical protein
MRGPCMLCKACVSYAVQGVWASQAVVLCLASWTEAGETPEFLEQFPNARFHFKGGLLVQWGTFKGVWLNEEHTEWALEKEQQ